MVAVQPLKVAVGLAVATKPTSGLDRVMHAAEKMGKSVKGFFAIIFDDAVRHGLAPQQLVCDQCGAKSVYMPQFNAYGCVNCYEEIDAIDVASKLTGIEYRSEDERACLAWMTWQLHIALQNDHAAKRILALSVDDETTVSTARGAVATIKAQANDTWLVSFYEFGEEEPATVEAFSEANAWWHIYNHPDFEHLAPEFEHDGYEAQAWGDFEVSEAQNATLAGNCPKNL